MWWTKNSSNTFRFSCHLIRKRGRLTEQPAAHCVSFR
jgi:hypothetical protein